MTIIGIAVASTGEVASHYAHQLEAFARLVEPFAQLWGREAARALASDPDATVEYMVRAEDLRQLRDVPEALRTLAKRLCVDLQAASNMDQF